MPKADYRIVDINTSKGLEVSWVPKGSNPLAKVVLKKSAEEPSQTEINMNLQVAIAKALAVGGARAAYVESLEKAEDLTAFFEKSADDQRTAVNAFAKAKSMPMEPDGDDTQTGSAKKETVEGAPGTDSIQDIVAKAVAAAVAPLQKSLEDANSRVETLQGGVIKATLEKRAQTEYRGLGLGIEKTVSLLKAVESIADAEARGTLENVLKAHAELTQRIAPAVGYDQLSKDASSATARLDRVVKELAKSANISEDDAFSRVNSDPEHALLIAEVDREEASLREAA